MSHDQSDYVCPECGHPIPRGGGTDLLSRREQMLHDVREQAWGNIEDADMHPEEAGTLQQRSIAQSLLWVALTLEIASEHLAELKATSDALRSRK